MHEPFAGIVPLLRMTPLPPPGTAAVPGAHVVAAPDATNMPDGNVFVNATPVIAAALGLPSVMVRSDVPPAPIVSGVMVIATVGFAFTVSVAPAPGDVPAFDVVTGPVRVGVCSGRVRRDVDRHGARAIGRHRGRGHDEARSAVGGP